MAELTPENVRQELLFTLGRLAELHTLAAPLLRGDCKCESCFAERAVTVSSIDLGLTIITNRMVMQNDALRGRFQEAVEATSRVIEALKGAIEICERDHANLLRRIN